MSQISSMPPATPHPETDQQEGTGRGRLLLRAFRPLRYNAAVVGDLSSVVAPPYDVISNTYRDVLYARSAHNVIRLILNREDDPYTTASNLLHEWRSHNVLVRDPLPALCYYVENFTLPDGSPHERAGLIAAVHLEPFSSGRIRPHERTFARAKEDRLRLVNACRTNFSAIFGLYRDKQDALDPARAVAARRAADIDLHDDSGARHRVWFLTQPPIIAALAQALETEEVVIADGHHRYETALAYRDSLRARGATDPEAPHNFVLMYLCSMSDPGLVVQPTHRLLHQLPNDANAVLEQLRPMFQLTAFPTAARQDFLAALRAAPGSIGIAFAGSPNLYVATVEDAARIASFVTHLASTVRQLDVAVLDSVILRGVLRVDGTAVAQAGQLTYTHDDLHALDAVQSGQAAAAFLMNPPRITDVLAVCAAGETMPEKSTYFYPKLLTGLVFHPLDENSDSPGR